MKTSGRVHPRRPHLLATALVIVSVVYWPHGQPARAQELPIVRFEAANYNFDEPEPGPATSQVTIAIELSAASASTVSVQVYLEDVTAIDGQDYISFDRTVTFLPGTTRREISITLLGNDHVEETERFGLKMRNPAGARFVGDNESQVTINDYDEYDAWLSYPSAVLEGESMPITLHFSQVVEYAVTLKVLSGEWTSDSHAATSGQDYDHFSGNIRLEEYQLSKTFNFPTNEDNEKEGWEVLALSLLENGCQRCNLLTPLNPGNSSQPLWIADEDIVPGMYLTSEFTKPTSNFHKKVIPLKETREEFFDIWLSRQPTSPVTVRLEKTGDQDLTASPSSHTFTPENWGNPFRVAVEAGADGDVYDGIGRVSFTTDTDDPLYSRENLSYVNLSECDTTTDTTGRRTFSQNHSDDADRLTVELAHAPKRHNGEDYWVILVFNEPIRNGSESLANVLETEGMSVKRTHRYAGNSANWAVQLRPGHQDHLTHLVVRGDLACSDIQAICAGGGKKLSNTLTVSIAGADGEAAKLPPGTDGVTPVATLVGGEVSEDLGQKAFQILLDRPAPNDVSVEFATYSITAEDGADYTGLPYQTVVIPQGHSGHVLTVLITNDDVAEDTEKFGAFIANPVGMDLDLPANQNDFLTAEMVVLDDD